MSNRARRLTWMVALLLALPRVASAHATLLRSNPAPNAHLPTGPARLTLTFSEAIEAGMTHLMLVSGSGRTISLDPSSDPHDVDVLVAPIDEALPPGGYRVEWHVVSADGHPVQGSFGFLVGDVAAGMPVPVVPDDETTTAVTWGPAVAGAPLIPALLRGLALVALMTLGGLLSFRATAPDSGTALGARAALLLSIAAPVLLAAHLAAWVVNASPDHVLNAQRLSDALGSEPGRLELARVVLAVLALWALVLARRARLALAFATLALVTSGASGHSAALHPAIAIPAKAIHLVAGSVWIGGLAWLLIRSRGDAAAFRPEVERVSGAALLALVVVLITGALQALLFVATPLDVLRTAYGAVVLAKVAGLLILAAFGAYHRYRTIPRLPAAHGMDGRLRATLRYELLVMTVVALLGGLLAYIPPAATSPASPAPIHAYPM